MKIHSANIRGAIGILKGQGVDEISLDLSNVSGLVAFDGPNGKGKSTVLENLHPFPTLASRKGALSHHFGLRDSFRDLSFSFNGDLIRTLIKVDSQSGKTEGFAWVNGQPKVDGKISSYKGFIEELLGSPNLFFNSVFCAQNSSKISDLTTGELKALFSEFLRLERYIKFEEISKQSANILAGQLAKINDNIKLIESKMPDRSTLDKDIFHNTHKKEIEETELKKISSAIEKLSQRIEAAKNKAAQNEKQHTRHADISKTLDQVKKDIKSDTEQSQKELEEIRVKAHEVILQIKPLEEILKDKKNIEAAVYNTKLLTEELPLRRADFDKENEALEKINRELNTRKKADKALKNAFSRMENNNVLSSLNTDLKFLKEQAEDLDKRDAECKSTTCTFIVKAVDASNKIPEIVKKIEEKIRFLNKAKSLISKKMANISAKIHSLRNEEAKIKDRRDSHKSRIDEINEDIEKHRTLASKIDQIKTADTTLETLRKQKDEHIVEGLKIKEKWDKRILELTKRQRETEETLEDIINSIDQKAERRVKAIEKGINILKSKETAITKAITELTSSIKDLENKLKEVDQLEKELLTEKQERIKVNSYISNFTYLKKACSKDGLRALEIDGVVPAILHETNDILSHTGFGSIKILTQDPETGKEIFDILVIDDEGEEVMLSLRSGGEKIWPIQALRLGMTLTSKQKSSNNYLTAFNDELDGPLDVENAKKFVGLYPNFMEKGKFETCFYITHKKECVDLADHRIIFNGGITIE